MKKCCFYGILIFIFSIVIGYSYSRIWNESKTVVNENSIFKEDVQNMALENMIIETVSEEEKILPTTSFAIKKVFDKCGHFKFSYAELPIEIINLNKNEVENMYNEWNVENFSSKEIVLSKVVDGWCNEHYIIKLDNGVIKIYNKIDDNNLKLYRETEISKEYLTKEDIEKLEVGILVYGEGKINSVIEDFE